MHKRVMEVLEHDETERTDAPLDISEYLLETEEDSIDFTNVNVVDEAAVNEGQSVVVPEPEEVCDHFRLEVLPIWLHRISCKN